MRKNKGYTLVELLVAMVVLVIVLMEVYMVMNSGSKVYEHGSVDVALQTEAQQTLLELEDLIIDVNSDITYTPQSGTVSENGTLTIVNHGDTYVIRYDGSDPKRAALGYGTLKYKHVVGAASATEIPLSDYVQYFYVDTSQISGHTGNSVVLSLKMNNGTYTYGASKEVFLRNKLGTGNGGGGTPTNDYDYDLVALRYKDYDLSDMNYEKDGDPCTYFVWEDASGTTFTTNMQDPSATYAMTSNKDLKCNSTTNTDWGVSGAARIWGYKDAATSTSNPSKHCVIQVTTDPVGCGNKDEFNSVAYFNWYQASTINGVCMTQIYGIDVNSAVKANYYMEYAPKGATINATARGTVLERDSGTPLQALTVSKTNATLDANLTTPINAENSDYPVSANPIFTAVLFDESGPNNKIYPDNAGGGSYSNLRGKQYVYMDVAQNTFCTFNHKQWTDVQIDTFESANEKFYGYADIEFPNSHHLKFPIYGILSGTDADADTARDITLGWVKYGAGNFTIDDY